MSKDLAFLHIYSIMSFFSRLIIGSLILDYYSFLFIIKSPILTNKYNEKIIIKVLATTRPSVAKSYPLGINNLGLKLKVIDITKAIKIRMQPN